MKKLIQLLNEYEKQFTDRPNYFWYKDKMLGKYIFCELNGRNIDNQELMIISRRYGFIKWLVENDKININEEWDDYEETNLSCNSDFFQLQKHYSYYESLLMLLAIQDNPIEFLISILR